MTYELWWCITAYTGYFDVNIARSLNYSCDCIDFTYLFLLKNTGAHIFDAVAVKCTHPLSLANESVIAVPMEALVCEWPDGCPSSCRCDYRLWNTTFHVYCSDANLSSLPLRLPPLPIISLDDKYRLDFSNNKLLRRLEHRPYIINTTILDVSNCALDFVDMNTWRAFAIMPSVAASFSDFLHADIDRAMGRSPIWSPRVVMPAVFLHGNKLESLPFNVTDINLTSVRLTLNDNPWKCSCDNRWMIALSLIHI